MLNLNENKRENRGEQQQQQKKELTNQRNEL